MSATASMAASVADWPECARFALYYAPPRDSAWWRAGCAWLGRDPESGATLVPPQLDGLDRSLSALTVAPQRYGWHATLVAPFRLAPGVTPDALFDAASRWAATRGRFDVPVDAATIGSFVALRPADDDGEAAEERKGAPAAPVDDPRPQRGPPEQCRQYGGEPPGGGGRGGG